MWVKCWSQLRGYLFAAAPTSWKSSVKFSFGPRRCEVFWSQLRVPPELVHMYITCSCMHPLSFVFVFVIAYVYNMFMHESVNPKFSYPKNILFKISYLGDIKIRD